MRIAIHHDEDSRWIAKALDLKGALAHDKMREQAISKAKALALYVVADRLNHGESVPELDELFAILA